jgi:uncharacterized protein YcfJ
MRIIMRTTFLAVTVMVSLMAAKPEAQAVGCLSGGAAGALAGHMAGHGVLGALGGCIAGHAWRKHQLNQDALESRQQYDSARHAQNPNYRSPWSN